jgi:hypothetical protein
VKLTARLPVRADDPAGRHFTGLADVSTGGIISVWTTQQGAPRWHDFLREVDRQGLSSALQLGVHFTTTDVARAEWSFWHVTGFTGYPQPEDLHRDGSYLDVTFDRSDSCRQCNTGLGQVAPFRMRGEPSLGRRSVMQMRWAYDAWFVTPAAYEAVFKPFGIASRPALSKGGRPLTSVVQLVIEERVPVDEYRTAGEVCEACGRLKLHSAMVNFAPQPTEAPTGPLALTAATYGSGGSAYHETLIRRDLVAAIHDAGLRGLSFHPCGDEEQRSAFEVASGVPAVGLSPEPTLFRSPAGSATPTLATPPRRAPRGESDVDTARRLLEQTGGLASTAALLQMGETFLAADELDDALTVFGRAAQRGDPEGIRQVAELLKRRSAD